VDRVRPNDRAPGPSEKVGALIPCNPLPGSWELTLATRSTGLIGVSIDETPAACRQSQARPADTMPSPLYLRDATVVTKRFTL
jgi:hypothetical protein